MIMRSIVAGAALTLAFSMAHGHGGSHARKPAYDPAKVEDQPFGRAGDPKKVTRTIQVSMSDTMRFTPDKIEVKRGETVRFVVQNRGKVLHEMVLGRMEELKEHAELMRKFPNMEHDEPHMAHVDPGKRGDMVWHFDKLGEFFFGCLIPGHFEAGMIGSIVVK